VGRKTKRRRETRTKRETERQDLRALPPSLRYGATRRFGAARDRTKRATMIIDIPVGIVTVRAN
jgi:hypothetical protein